ncbi:clasp N-terminal domain-containing protein [Catenaria anguillulae PL171]|uniref:Clasp N-terminal domain-containing protein n=1 Tax=Catenaria anguillulae PL171 TaxID=765915 RepID=A0A1Y2HZV4_9FUNG|nr:clasp N-terminal domain-containing protein [Catenaria anguillulae PL171]
MLDFDIPDPVLRRELNSLGQLIGAKETEQNWQSIDKAVGKLTAIIAQHNNDGEPSHRDSLFKFVKAKRTNLVAYLKTERTSFSGTVCKLLETIATTFAATQHSPDELFIEPLISLTSRTNKLFQQRSTAALLAIMASASPDLIVPKLAEAAKHKSSPTRLSTTQCFKKLLEVDQERPDKLESHTPSIEAALKLLTQDAVQQIRELARTTVSLYMKMFSLRANLCVAPSLSLPCFCLRNCCQHELISAG